MIKKIVAVQECAEGNETIGHAWLETAIFLSVTPMFKILEWRESLNGNKGRLFITIPTDKTE